MFDASDDLLDVDAACQALRLGRTALYRYIRQGKIAAIRHGRMTYIERREIEDYWSRQRAEANRVRVARARGKSDTPAGKRRGTSADSRRDAA